MPEKNHIERVLLHDRLVVVGALVLVVVASWIYLLMGAGTGMSTWAMTSWRMALGLSKAMAMPVEWSPAYAVVMFFMWWIMMIAMMLPSAAPMVLVYSKIQTKSALRAGAPQSIIPTAAFVGGYLAAWAAFSIVAAAMQWLFEAIGVLSPMMMHSTNEVFAGLILVFAGLYQMTPLKQACLEHCRGPLSFLMHHWQPGTAGAFRMGLHHGAYCLGCCWGLMAILFFGGIMNLYWIIALAVLVLIEKVLPPGPTVAYISGALLAMWGATFLFSAAA